MDMQASVTKFQADLSAMERRTQTMAQRMENSFRGAQRTVGGFLAHLSRVHLMLATLAGGGGIGLVVNRSLEMADTLADTADKLGVNVEVLQELRYAAQQNGVQQNTLDMALQRFNRRVAEAAHGTGEAKAALQELGIQLTDNQGRLRNTEDLLGDVADAMQRTHSQADRLRLGFKLFDSEGVALVNMLRSGRITLEQWREEAREAGVVLDESMIRRASQARDRLDQLSLVIQSNMIRAVVALAPHIESLATKLADLAADWAFIFNRMAAESDQSSDVIAFRIAEITEEIERLRKSAAQMKAQPGLLLPGREQVIARDVVRRIAELEAERERLRQLLRQALQRETKPLQVSMEITRVGLPTDVLRALESQMEGLRGAEQRLPAFEKPFVVAESLEEMARVGKVAVADMLQSLESLSRGLEGAETMPTDFERARDVAEGLKQLAAFARQIGEDFRAANPHLETFAQGLVGAEEAMSGIRPDPIHVTGQAVEELVDQLERERDALMLTGEELAVFNALSKVSGEMTDFQRERIAALAVQVHRLKEAQEEAEERAKRFETSILALQQPLASAFEDAIFNGERLSDVLGALAEDIARLTLRWAILNAVQAGLNALPTGGGGVGLSAAQVQAAGGAEFVSAQPMQHGGVVKRPTLIVAGEAGPEAIVPLERLGGGVKVEIVNNAPGVQVRPESPRRGPNGEDVRRFVIETVQGGFDAGFFDGPMRRRFAAAPRVAGR